jgi:hypothetical protein
MNAHKPNWLLHLETELAAREAELAPRVAAVEEFRAVVEDARRLHGAAGDGDPSTVEVRSKKSEARTSNVAPPTHKPRRASPVAPGTIEDRILSVLKAAGEPVPPRVLVQECKADRLVVQKACKRLEADKRIVGTGVTMSRRYALA